MSRPAVSVLMAVRDGERYVAAAVESVLAQTVPPAEVVVVDDGSVDGTAEILRGFGGAIRVVRQSPAGVAAAHNRAVREARHGVVTFLDADDLYPPTAVEARLDRLAGTDGPDAVGGALVQFVSPELPADVAARFRFEPGPVQAALLGALLLRRDCFTRFGAFDEAHAAPSVDWMAHARFRGIRITWTDEVVLRRRIHGGNLSHRRQGDERRALLDAVRRHHRRRAPSP